ncbi:MAG TPA: flagellar basal body P-ring formation chaperone FlgA [Dongiaceae bacterium]|nr:flagellar basal body P-ring formation chaperone FlgA [Dongiaceae bacterium]
MATFNFSSATCRVRNPGRRPVRWKLRVKRWLVFSLFACLGGGFALSLRADEPSNFELHPTAITDGGGLMLAQLVTSSTPLPAVRLTDAPAFGTTAVITREQIAAWLRDLAPGVTISNWTGAAKVQVSRRSRQYNEADLMTQLTAALQQEYVKDKGDLELRFTRSWTTLNVPDEPLTLKVLELPLSGVTPSCIVRFELRTDHEIVGNWQMSIAAHVWREVWVARSALRRGDRLSEADVTREKRDVLAIRDPLADFTAGDPTLEFSETVPAGGPILARALKPRAVIHRGQTADAIVRNGALTISLKVQALEDGVPGQSIHARNLDSRHDITGTVIDEQTIEIPL